MRWHEQIFLKCFLEKYWEQCRCRWFTFWRRNPRILIRRTTPTDLERGTHTRLSVLVLWEGKNHEKYQRWEDNMRSGFEIRYVTLRKILLWFNTLQSSSKRDSRSVADGKGWWIRRPLLSISIQSPIRLLAELEVPPSTIMRVWMALEMPSTIHASSTPTHMTTECSHPLYSSTWWMRGGPWDVDPILESIRLRVSENVCLVSSSEISTTTSLIPY